jgi:high affinity Mn2+ porin
MINKILLLICGLLCILAVQAQTKTDSTTLKSWSYHFQATTVIQNYVPFNAPYSALNSLPTKPGDNALSLTSTLFLGHRLWKNASMYFEPEVAGGKGINGATGIAGFTNGETFRIGDPTPQWYIARAFFHQNIGLRGCKYNRVHDDVTQVDEMVPDKRIAMSAGKFAISDFFDNNKYSHDPRAQFL